MRMPCPVMHVRYICWVKERTAFTLQVKLCLLFLHVSFNYLCITASPMVRKNVGNTPRSCKNGSEKSSEVLVSRAARTTQPISVAISWGLSSQDA